jgi:hypothetical protein
MRQWRVGSFSMGLLLVLLGVGLLLDRFRGSTTAFELINNWWPVVLILLGVEVLAVGFLDRNQTVKFKYDFWSMLLVVFFFCFSLGIYALDYSGIMPRLKEAVTARDYSVTLAEEKYPLDGINKIVLSSTDQSLELRGTGGRDLHIFGQAAIIAASFEDAARLAALGGAEIYTAGDTMFVQFNQIPYQRGNFYPGLSRIQRTVLIPADVAVEIQAAQSEVHLFLDTLAAPWSISGGDSVRATLSAALDVTINGATLRANGLKGDAAWEPLPGGEGAGGHSGSAATFQLGEGSWPLHLAAYREITVNIRRQ